MMKTTTIFGFPFICDLSYEEISDLIIEDVETNEIITNVITPNAHGIVSYHAYPDLNAFCQQSKYVLPDGQPLVLLSRFSNHPIQKRLTGSDLFPVLFDKINNTAVKILFILSDESLIGKFQEVSNNARYYVPPFLKMNEAHKIQAEGLKIAELIQEYQIQLVFFGISEPKQGALSQVITKILLDNKYNKSCIFLFLGASYEFYFGIKKRAPLIFQKLSLEWFYRLMMEPRRLLKRYTVTNAQFIFLAIQWMIHKKRFDSKK
jgi:N-acetylglucosaminyldiphosphoundecaprenol N-acetyl-beta-D-mannosaminyltransferase